METRTISGKEFQSEPLPFDAGWSLGVRLAALVGASAPTSIAELASDAGLLGMLGKVPAALAHAGALPLLGELFARTEYIYDDDKGRARRVCLRDPAARELAFGHDYACALQVMRFALETNYRDSLQEIAAWLPKQSPKP